MTHDGQGLNASEYARELVLNQDLWAVILINPNATVLATEAAQQGLSTYDNRGAISFFYEWKYHFTGNILLPALNAGQKTMGLNRIEFPNLQRSKKHLLSSTIRLPSKYPTIQLCDSSSNPAIYGLNSHCSSTRCRWRHWQYHCFEYRSSRKSSVLSFLVLSVQP